VRPKSWRSVVDVGAQGCGAIEGQAMRWRCVPGAGARDPRSARWRAARRLADAGRCASWRPRRQAGAADLFGRLMADHLSEILKERLLCRQSRPAAGGLIGAPDHRPCGARRLHLRGPSSIAYHAIAPGREPESRLRSDPRLHPYRLYGRARPTAFVVNPALNVRFARRAGGARPAAEEHRLRVARPSGRSAI